MVQIDLTDHQIIYGRQWPVERVNLIILLQLYMQQAEWLQLHAVAPELRFDFGIDPYLVVTFAALDVACRDGRMVAHLLAYTIVVGRSKFKSLAQERIEWFTYTLRWRFVLGNIECS